MIKVPGNNTEIRLLDGDRINLKEFFDNYFPIFVSFAGKYIPDTMVNEDIVQSAFISFWEKKNTYQNWIALKGFFYTTIRNACLDHLKHMRVEEKYRDYNRFLRPDSETFLDEVLKTEAHQIVYQEINKLPEMGKNVLLLALLEKSNEEIAASLNIAINTVKTHKARAYKILRKNLPDLFLIFLPFRKSFAESIHNVFGWE